LLSNATATSRDGSVVVGYSLTTTSSASDHAFIWTAKTGMQDLNNVVHPPKGWILQVATDISEDGTVITGYGISPPTKQFPFGEMEPWRAVLSSKWWSAIDYGVRDDGAALQQSHEPRIHDVLSNAIAAAGANDGLTLPHSSSGKDAAATMAAPTAAAPTTAMPAPLNAAAVDQFFAAAGKADQPLSLAGQSPAGTVTAAPSGTMPAPQNARAVDPFFAADGMEDHTLSLARHSSWAHAAAVDGNLDVLAANL
jgi:probable HAF family extracellular repeat protein